MDDLATKCIGTTRLEVKDASRGEVEAVVARVGVVDRDGDLFTVGSFGERSVRVSEFNHRSWPQRGGDRPIGRGTIRERGSDVVASLKFFMGTTAGREAFETVKELGDVGEWSYGWLPGTEKTAELSDEYRQLGARRVISDVPVVEVSPVLMGASIGTRTVAAKCDKCSTDETEADEKAEKDLREQIQREVDRYERIKAERIQEDARK